MYRTDGNYRRLRGQFFKREHRSRNHMTQSIQEQGRRLPAVEAESHFVQIGLQMLRADLVPRSHDAALEEREGGFNGVRVDISAHVFFRFVVDCLVLPAVDASFNHGRWIASQFVSDHDLHVGADIFLDVLGQRARLRICRMKKPQIAAALPDADYDFFLILAVPDSLASLFSAYIGFVHFDSTVEHRLVYLLHRVPDAVTEIPCGLVGTFVLAPDRAPDLISGHSFAGFAEQQRDREPFGQFQVGVMKDGASGNGELVIAILAIEQLGRGRKPDNFTGLASRTLGAFWPAQPLQQIAAFIIGREQFGNVRESHCAYPI